MKYQEIAAELGVSEKTVYKHLHQAITTLHEHFKDQEQ
jgi:DNA-directed RNA polymerase specialized sigma24 family protein